MENLDTSEKIINPDADKWLTMAKDIEKDNSTEEKELSTPEDKLGSYFNDEKFMKKFETCSAKEKETVVAQMLNCYILFGDNQHQYYDECFDTIMAAKEDGAIQSEYQFQKRMTNFFIDTVSLELGVTKQDENYEHQVFDYFNEHLNINGYGFHAYNGVYDNSIREKGLCVSRDSANKTLEEIKTLNDEVFSYYYGFNPFFYYLNDAKREESSNIFYDLDPKNAYSYGKKSPEWFDIFVSTLYNNFGSPFAERDYGKARSGIENWCNDKNASDTDRAKIIDFFEEKWAKYASTDARPKVALIPRKTLGKTIDLTYNQCKSLFSNDSFLEKIAFALLHNNQINKNYDKDIPASELKIIDLPRIN